MAPSDRVPAWLRASASRRDFARGGAAFFGTAALLPGCITATDDDSTADDDSTGDDDSVGDDDSASSLWATGGAAAVGGPYDDPFSVPDPAPCALLCSATLGPCYGETFDRKDISDGEPGLPMRIVFLVLDEACNPVPGAEVDIWHTSVIGLYSGDDTAQMCTDGNEAALQSHWFRGKQTADASGRVEFDSCFPGWYPSRALHIHLTVRVGGDNFVNSQLYFPHDLQDDVLVTHPDYSERGLAQVSNSEDGILPQEAGDAVLFRWARMDDGVLMVWKTLVVRSSLADPLCAT